MGAMSAIGTRFRTMAGLMREKEEKPAPIISEEEQRSIAQAALILEHAKALAEMKDVVINEHTQRAIAWLESLPGVWREADRKRRDEAKKNGKHDVGLL